MGNGIVRTGISGLDDILLGGIPRSNVIMVEGTMGSGKTLLGLEFIYRGIKEFNEPGIIVVFEVGPDKLIRDAATLGWDLEELQVEKKLQIVFTSPQVLADEMRSADSLLLETAVGMGAERIFIDGIGLLRQAGKPSRRAADTGGESFRELLHQLIGALNREQLTAMISHELGADSQASPTSEAAGFLADTVIRLRRSLNARRIHRSLEIVKSRGQNYVPGEHTLEIQDGKGLEVFRRVQAPYVDASEQPTSNVRRSIIGVAALDDLLGGGVFDGSTTMVVGLSGVGKTVLGTQLLREGALNQGKRGMLISLDEHPEQIIRNAATLNLDLQKQVDDGTIRLVFDSPQELNVDTHFAKIVRAVELHGIQRLVIDGMTSYSTALGTQDLYRDFFHALVAYSKRRLLTTFFSYENPEFLGLSTFMPEFPVSSIVDNIILLSLVEVNSTLRRCLTVVKARGSAHQFDSREYVIGNGGISFLPHGPLIDTQPLANYTGILSRAPSRVVAQARPSESR